MARVSVQKGPSHQGRRQFPDQEVDADKMDTVNDVGVEQVANMLLKIQEKKGASSGLSINNSLHAVARFVIPRCKSLLSAGRN